MVDWTRPDNLIFTGGGAKRISFTHLPVILYCYAGLDQCPGLVTNNINVCAPCVTHTISYAIMRLDISIRIYYPQLLSKLKITSTSPSSISLGTNLSTPGTIICGAFPRDGGQPNSVFDILNVGFSTKCMDSSCQVGLNISDLAPATYFRIYCYTQDFNSHVMPFMEAVHSAVISQTKCCKSLGFSSDLARIPASNGVVLPNTPTFQITRNAVFSYNYKIDYVSAEIMAQAIQCNSSVVLTGPARGNIQVIPNTFTFQGLQSMEHSFVVLAAPGCYQLIAVDTSPYNIFQSGVLNLVVTSLDSKPPPPVTQSAVYSGDGRSVFITFDSATDYGASSIPGFNGLFECSQLVSFVPLSHSPTSQPTRSPSGQPSCQPSRMPSQKPHALPSRKPSAQPTRQPSSQPIARPSRKPTAQPTCRPSLSSKGAPKPVKRPTSQPSGQPSRQPVRLPSGNAQIVQTFPPTRHFIFLILTKIKSILFVYFYSVYFVFCCFLGQPTQQPSRQPTKRPSRTPSSQPVAFPTARPSLVHPTSQPVAHPSLRPSSFPSARPSTEAPTSSPSAVPSWQPSSTPSATPLLHPTQQPTVTQSSSYPSTSHPTNPPHTFVPTSLPLSIFCSWQSSQVVVVNVPPYSVLAGQAILRIGDPIFLLGNKVKAACTTGNCQNYSYSEFTYTPTLIAAPPSPIKPVVALMAPATVGSCADVVFDATPSTGNGGRSWLSVSWQVKMIPGTSLVNPQVLNNYLNRFQDISTLITVPNQYWERGNTYSIMLTLQNFMGVSASATATVTVSMSTAIPSVSIVGPNSISTLRSSSLNLFALATTQVCPQNASLSQKLKYTWSVYEDFIYRSEITSTALDPRYFILPAYVLNSATKYTIRVMVAGKGGTAAYSVSAFVGQGGVTANIAGGTNRVVTTTLPLVMDARGSYDNDYPELSPQNLVFTWTCYQITPHYKEPCVYTMPALSISNPYLELTIQNKSSISASTSLVYNFTITASNDYGTAGSFSSLITVLQIPLPTVTIGPVAAKFNPDQRITLNGTVTVSQTAGQPYVDVATCAWAMPTVAALGVSALTSLSTSISVPRYFPTTTLYQLSLQPSTLSPGLVYTLQLSCAYVTPGSQAAVTTVSIVMNQPPTGGILGK